MAQTLTPSDHAKLLRELENTARQFGNMMTDFGDSEEAHEAYALQTRARAAATEIEEQGKPEWSDSEIENAFQLWWLMRHGEPHNGAVPLPAVIEWTRYTIETFASFDGGEAKRRRVPTGDEIIDLAYSLRNERGVPLVNLCSGGTPAERDFLIASCLAVLARFGGGEVE